MPISPASSTTCLTVYRDGGANIALNVLDGDLHKGRLHEQGYRFVRLRRRLRGALPQRHQVPVREDASQALCVNNVENFKTKVRRITPRSHNLDAEVPRCPLSELRASRATGSVYVPPVGSISAGPPGAGNPHAGKYEESTSSR